MQDITTYAALALAGAAAGLVGSAGGITSLISFPALLAAGLPAHAANVANGVALVACLPGSALGSRRELRGRGAWLRRWTPVAAAGAAAGAIALLLTPGAVFARVVPFLVAVGSLSLLAAPRIAARRGGGSGDGAPPRRGVLAVGVALLSSYNGYFGAGSGVMTLTLMLACVDGRMSHANALKNMLIGAASLATAATLVAAGPVDWSAAVPTAVGMLAGSRTGPTLTRHMNPTLLRHTIALSGLLLATWLWLQPTP